MLLPDALPSLPLKPSYPSRECGNLNALGTGPTAVQRLSAAQGAYIIRQHPPMAPRQAGSRAAAGLLPAAAVTSEVKC
jgi:hypothetical protein